MLEFSCRTIQKLIDQGDIREGACFITCDKKEKGVAVVFNVNQ